MSCMNSKIGIGLCIQRAASGYGQITIVAKLNSAIITCSVIVQRVFTYKLNCYCRSAIGAFGFQYTCASGK